MEVWKPVCGFDGKYAVSNLGRVKSLPGTEKYYRCGHECVRGRKEKILSPSTDKDGYKKVNLSIDGAVFRRSVHRLVAQAFIPNGDNKPAVNHINGIKDDNRVSNLEWVTNSENTIHKFRVLGYKGYRRPVICTNDGTVYGSATEAALALKIDKSHLVACCRGKRAHSKGYTFQYFVSEGD